MNDLFGYAFARLERGKDKRTEFAQIWENYISTHPWDTVVNEVAERTFELRVAVLTPTPSELSLIFSE